MISISMKAELDRMKARLDDVQKRQLPYATRRALTDTVRLAETELRAALPRIFDRPTPFTLRGVYSKPATGPSGGREEAFLALRDYAGKGTPASTFLAPEILGGERNLKRFERRLDRASGLSGGMATIPTASAQLDQFGNVSTRSIGQMLGHLRAFDDGQNVSRRKLARLRKQGLLVKTARGDAKFFVAKSKADGQPLGIWTILGRGFVAPVLLFARQRPTYRPRLNFYAFAEASFRTNFAERLRVRLAEALATARK